MISKICANCFYLHFKGPDKVCKEPTQNDCKKEWVDSCDKWKNDNYESKN